MPSEPFAVQVKALAEERGLSVSKLAWKAHDPNTKGTAEDTLHKVLQGKRPLNDALARAVAAALEVDPERFVEYRLSAWRHALDEREVGFERAATLLAELEGLLTTRPADAAPPEMPAELGRFDEAAPTSEQKAPSTKTRRAQGSR
jgi:hypothetical protein